MSLPDPAADLTSGDDARAEAAAVALGSREDGLAILGPLLASADPDQRWWAVRALAELPAAQAAPHLAAALQDPDPAVRHCAALGLSRRPHAAAVPALVEAMRSKDSLFTRLAANALAAAGLDATPALLELLQNAPSAVRLEAVRALAQIGDPRSIPALFAALDEDSALMEYWANAGLERMGVGMTFFKP